MTMLSAVGLSIMIVSQAATFAGIEPFASWNTPIAWTGFILFADGVVFRARGRSWLRSSPGELAFLAAVSIPLWLVFEFYNLFIENWFYVGLPEHFGLRMFGFAWAFATIWPAIFEGADLVSVWRRCPLPRATSTPTSIAVIRNGTRGEIAAIVFGAGLLVWPLLWPSQYLAAPVWLGFIALLDPVNRRLGAESLVADWERGQIDRVWNLALGGLLCGFIWEFINYWARAKWHYTVPIMENVKLFEMPLPGYLGFPAFALECFTMYVFVRTLLFATLSAARRGQPHPIAL
jgi:hypothetical protein